MTQAKAIKPDTAQNSAPVPAPTPVPVAQPDAQPAAVSTPTPAPVVQAAPPEPVKKGPPKKLPPRNLQLAEFARNVFAITPEVGTTMEDILEPEYFAHVGVKFKPRDIIEVTFEDMSRYAWLIVIDADRLWAKTKVVMDTDLSGAKAEGAATRTEKSPQLYEVIYKGLNDKWIVKRLSDGETMKANLANKEEGQKWITEHMKALAR